ncbi:unnamed protein product [Rhodiola kirilowii]
MAESRLTADSMYLLKSLSSNLDSEAMLDEEIELTLGLSLNGRFGVDPPKLARSSSMNPYTSVESAAAAAGYVANVNLMRTCSLPVEPEEEVMKRKEMQSLRRMEAKRKRIEKRAAIPLKPEKRVSKGGFRSEKSTNRPVSFSHSQGISLSESSESQIIQGMCKSVEPIEQMQMESVSDRKVRCPSLGTGMKNQFKELTVSDSRMKESLVKNPMLDMPCVSTQGDGPDGKRIEGLLYRYNKSEEVRIVCVCHGKFMSPAEFVKHAGGTDFEQPLKHIVVTPSHSQCL